MGRRVQPRRRAAGGDRQRHRGQGHPVGDEKEAGFFPSRVGVWEVSSGRLLWSEPTDEVDQAELRFGPDGKLLYWGGRGRVLGRGVGEKDGASRSLAGCNGDVTALAVSRDGARLAFAGEDRVVRLWDLRQGREDRSFRGPVEAVRHLAFSADGRTLASVEQGGRLRRWRTDRELPGLTLPTPGPNAASPQVMAVTPTLDRCVALARIRGRNEGGATLYDLTGRGRPAVPIEGEYQGSLRVPISDGGELVALQEKRDLVLYDAATGRRRVAIPVPFPKGGDPDSFPAELAFVAQGRELLAAWVEWEKRGGPLRFQARAWGVEDGRERWAFEAPLAPAPGRKNPTVAFASALAVGAGGRLAVGVSWFHEDREMDLELVGCVLLLDRNDPGAPRRFDVSEPVVSLAFGEAGRTLAGFATSVTSGVLHLWDAEKGVPIHRHPVHAGSVWAVCFHPTEDRVVTAGADKLLRVWDSRSGVELLSLAGHRRTVTGLRFDAEGRRLASWTGLPLLSILGMDMKRSERGEAGEVRVWDAVPTTSLSPASPSPGP